MLNSVQLIFFSDLYSTHRQFTFLHHEGVETSKNLKTNEQEITELWEVFDVELQLISLVVFKSMKPTRSWTDKLWHA